MRQQTALLMLARLLERGGYFGVRSILTLYMVNGFLQFDNQKAVDVYGWFVLGLTVSYLPGALLGDLFLGNRKAMVIGAATMTVGVFVICLPTEMAFYAGMALLCIGMGLFDGNFLSQFGKQYLERKNLLDSRFAFLYALVNIGAVSGGSLITFLAYDAGNYLLGFVCGGILLLASCVVSLFTKQQEITIGFDKSSSNRIFLIVGVVILIGSVYWMVYEFASDNTYFVKEQLMMAYSPAVWIINGGVGAVLIPLCLMAGVVWMFKFYSQWIKLGMGLLFAAAAFLVLSGMSGDLLQISLLNYSLAALFLALSELNIQPIIYAMLAKYSNPKYLAIVMSLAVLPTKIVAYFFPLYLLHQEGNETNELLWSAILLIVISIVMAVVVKIRFRQNA